VRAKAGQLPPLMADEETAAGFTDVITLTITLKNFSVF
jgi:hypothetical protein